MIISHGLAIWNYAWASADARRTLPKSAGIGFTVAALHPLQYQCAFRRNHRRRLPGPCPGACRRDPCARQQRPPGRAPSPRPGNRTVRGCCRSAEVPALQRRLDPRGGAEPAQGRSRGLIRPCSAGPAPMGRVASRALRNDPIRSAQEGAPPPPRAACRRPWRNTARPGAAAPLRPRTFDARSPGRS